MAYGNFTLAQLKKTFDLSFQESSGLFSTLPSVEGSNGLIETLAEGVELAILKLLFMALSPLVRRGSFYG